MQEHIDEHTRDCFNFRMLTAYTLHHESDSLRKLYEALGIVDSVNAAQKLTFKHESVNKKDAYELDHNLTSHSVAL